jgi:cephalosporin hydroxylase
VTLVEGSSVEPAVIEQVRLQIRSDERVLVLLDSCHSKAHVLAELRAYAPLVNIGSYIVVADGIMGELAGKPGTRPEWVWDNPQEASREFAGDDPRFQIEEPAWPFNEGPLSERVTYWPSAYLRRVA